MSLLENIKNSKSGLAAFHVLEKLLNTQATHKEAVNYVLGNGLKHAVSKIEFGYIYDPNGNKVLAKKGAFKNVKFTKEEINLIREKSNSTLVHNHPSNSSISEKDFYLQHGLGLKKIHAIGHNGVEYAGQVLKPDFFAEQYQNTNKALINEFKKLIDNRVLTVEATLRLHYHILNILLDKAGIISYSAKNAEDYYSETAGEVVQSVIDLLVNDLKKLESKND